MTLRERLRFEPTEEGHRVTPLELFFDLVFVYALTQVTAMLADDTSAVGVLRAVLVLMLLWFGWCSYAWLGNQAKADEGVVRAGLVVAMAAMFVVALSMVEAFEDAPGGLYGPLVFVSAIVAVRLVHLTVYVVAAGGDRDLLRRLRRTAVTVAVWATLLVVGAFLDSPAQLVLWSVALLVDYVGIFAGGADGWQLNAPGHFAERHGLIIIIALGESIVAIGVGAEALAISGPLLVAVLLGMAVSVALWWAYFDVVALVAERTLVAAQGAERLRMARDSFTYLHFPMVAGIIFLALGMKKVVSYVGDTEHHDLTEPLTGIPLVALYGGVVVYLLAHVAFRLRNIGSVNRPRVAVAVLIAALVPLAWQLPALAALGLLAAVLIALIAFESLHYADARHAIRHAEHT